MKLTHPFLVLAFALICGLSSCQSSDDIDAGFLNDSDLLYANFTDSLLINATLLKSEPTNLESAQSDGVFLLGALDDPTFGKSIAAMCMQFTLGTGQNNLSFDSVPVLDSVVLSLAYSTSGSSYGMTEDWQDFTVFEITDSLVFSSADDELTDYFTDDFCNVDQILGESTLLFNRDSIIVDTDSLAPSMGINIRLDDAFGERFLAASETDDSTFFNIVTFLGFFKGLAIVPDESNTAIAPFNLRNSDTRLKFYYKAYPSGEDTLSERTKSFLVRSQIGTNNVLALNEFKHDYTTATSLQMLLNDGGKVTTDLAYLQSMAGLELELEIPELFDLGQIIVNKAELEINNLLDSEENDSLYFPQPALIGFQILDSEDEELFDGAGQVSVVTDTTADNEIYRMNRYTLPLTLSTQRLLEEGKGNSTFIVKLVETPLNPFRLVVNGPEAELFPMKFRLFYTEIDK